jgi:hypothetical protein
MALTYLSSARVLAEDGLLREDRYIWRSPYSLKQRASIREHMGALLAADLVERSGDGWRITSRGTEVYGRVNEVVRAALRAHALPAKPTRHAAEQLGRLAERIPASAARAAAVRRVPRPPESEPASDAVTLNRTVQELWSFRDDCHIGAWEAAGYEGPTVDVLTQAWSGAPDIAWATQGGHATVEAVAKALHAKQDRADVERNVGALVERGDLTRDGDAVAITAQGQRSRDAIEEETDRRYFAIWDLDDAATARLGDDLRTVIDALPKA